MKPCNQKTGTAHVIRFNFRLWPSTRTPSVAGSLFFIAVAISIFPSKNISPPLRTLEAIWKYKPGMANGSDSSAQDMLPIFRWKHDPGTMIIKFPTGTAQAAMLNRVAAFVEKNGLRNRIPGEKELRIYLNARGLNSANFYLGHDYRERDLHHFFAYARKKNIKLRREEKVLRNLLMILGKESKGGKTGVLLSIGADVPPRLQSELLIHEARHALFFRNARYRSVCENFWNRVLTEKDRRAFRRLFSGYDYDPTDEYLMRNEFQALLLHRHFRIENYPSGIRDASLREQTTKYFKQKRVAISSWRKELDRRLRKFNALFRGLP